MPEKRENMLKIKNITGICLITYMKSGECSLTVQKINGIISDH